MRILVASVNSSLHELVHELLEGAGLSVISAISPEHLRNAIRAASFDLIVVDELVAIDLQELRGQQATARLWFLTEELLSEVDADYLFLKPIDPHLFVSQLREFVVELSRQTTKVR